MCALLLLSVAFHAIPFVFEFCCRSSARLTVSCRSVMPHASANILPFIQLSRDCASHTAHSHHTHTHRAWNRSKYAGFRHFVYLQHDLWPNNVVYCIFAFVFGSTPNSRDKQKYTQMHTMIHSEVHYTQRTSNTNARQVHQYSWHGCLPPNTLCV